MSDLTLFVCFLTVFQGIVGKENFFFAMPAGSLAAE